MKALSAAQKLIQGLVLAKLQEDVDVFSVLKEVLEPDDVIVMEAAVDLNLTHELLLSSRLGQRGLSDDFSGRDSLGLKVSELVALGETSFSEELAPQVLFDADVAVEFDDLLLDDDLGVVLGGLGGRLLLLHGSIIVSIIIIRIV